MVVMDKTPKLTMPCPVCGKPVNSHSYDSRAFGGTGAVKATHDETGKLVGLQVLCPESATKPTDVPLP